MDLTLFELVLIALLGLVGGTLGGLLGVGGSVIFLPGMVLLFGQDQEPGFNQHLYQATAMIVNVAVALPAAWRHRRAGAIRFDVLKWILPAAFICIFIGVWLSNFFTDPVWLGRLLAAFMVYVIVLNVRKLLPGKGAGQPTAEVDAPDGTTTRSGRPLGIGVIMGTVAGLLGIGGGAVAVPLQQVLLKLPLRVCIANSAAVICITAGFGAIAKNATLPPDCSVRTSLALATLLAPTAIVGGLVGARLTHVLPVPAVRIAFIVLMMLAAWKMAF